MTLPKVVTSTTKIRFQDCDPFNHLNNGSYINYFINHREDQLIIHYDIDIYDMAKAVDREMQISGIMLTEKKGGKSGHWVKNPE